MFKLESIKIGDKFSELSQKLKLALYENICNNSDDDVVVNQKFCSFECVKEGWQQFSLSPRHDKLFAKIENDIIVQISYDYKDAVNDEESIKSLKFILGLK